MRVVNKVLIYISVLFLTACSEPATETLRIGTNIWPGYEPLYLAREHGHFASQPVRLVEYAAATEVIRAFRNGAIDAAALTLDEVLMLAQHGLKPRLVLVMDFSHGGDAVIARNGIESLNDLKSRKVGVEDSALGAYMLQRTLDQVGLDYADIEVVPLPVDYHERAFREGRVDAVVTFEPVRSKLIADGGRELFNSAGIPGEIVDVLVVRDVYAERHPEVVSALLTGWFKALKTIQETPEESAALMGQREGLTGTQFQAALDMLHIPTLAENRAQLEGPRPELLATAERLQAVMMTRGLQQHPVQMDTLFERVDFDLPAQALQQD